MTFADFIFKYTNASTGKFKDQLVNDIKALYYREFTEDITTIIQDNAGPGVTDGDKGGVQVTSSGLVWTPKDFFQGTVLTTGGTITLNLNSKERGYFWGSATFATAKAVAITNATRGTQFDFVWEVTNVAATLDFDSDLVRSVDARMYDEDGNFTGIFVPQDVGLYKVRGVRWGTLWLLDFRGVYSVGDAPPEPDPTTWLLYDDDDSVLYDDDVHVEYDS